jgi:hypothetical protein
VINSPTPPAAGLGLGNGAYWIAFVERFVHKSVFGLNSVLNSWRLRKNGVVELW